MTHDSVAGKTAASGINPVHRLPDWRSTLPLAQAAPRCGATSRRTGQPCRAPAMANGRCRMHGGASTGPRTPEGLERSRRARYVHGEYSVGARAALRYIRMIVRLIRPVIKNTE